MKKCTKHAIRRYVQRVVGKTNTSEINEYIARNQEEIVERINKSFNYATFVYHGQIGDNISRNYFVKDRMIFVTNSKNDTIVTIIIINFGFSDSINLMISRELLKEIKELQIRIDREQVTKKKMNDVERKRLINGKTKTSLELDRTIGLLLYSKNYREELRVIQSAQ